MFKSKWILPITLAAILSVSAIPSTGIEADAKVKATKKVSYKTPLNTATTYHYAKNLTAKYGYYDVVTYLARSNYGVNKNYYTNYYKDVEKVVKSNKGKVEESAGSLAKTIISLNAIGKNPKKVANYNLVDALGDKLLEEKNKGNIAISNAIYTLIALESDNLSFSNSSKYKAVSKDELVKLLVSTQFENGGFSWEAGNVDGVSVDMTAMALTALSSFSDESTVKAAIRKGLDYMSNQLNTRAGYAVYADNNADTQAQVLVALTENGINPKTSHSFIKNGHWGVSNILLNFDAKLGGFKSSTTDLNVNPYTNSSGILGLTAYDRYATNKPSFYDLENVKSSSLKYDTKAPSSIKVNTITNNTTTISGTVEPYAKVQIYNGSKIIHTQTTTLNGKYSIKLAKKVKANSSIKVYVTDLAKNKSKAFTYKVKDVLTPATPKVNKVVKGAKKVTGTTTKGAVVTVQIGKKSYKATASKTTGKFSVKVPTVVAKHKLIVSAKKAGYMSKKVTITVKSK